MRNQHDHLPTAGASTPRNPGKPGNRFGDTRWSLVLRAGGPRTALSSQALAELCAAYRSPLVAFAGYLPGLDRDRAEDLVQGFFVRVVERDVVGAADPARGRFRVFLRTALRNYARNCHMEESRLKRGGQVRAAGVEPDALSGGEDHQGDRLYDQLWAQTVLDRALARLADALTAEGKSALFAALRDRLADEDDRHDRRLADIAADLGLSTINVRVTLCRWRDRYYGLVREEAADTLERPGEVDAELRDLRASWPVPEQT